MLKRSTITLILRFPQNSVTEKDLQKEVIDPLMNRLHDLSTIVSANCSSHVLLDPTKSIQECVEEYNVKFVVCSQAYVVLSSAIASLIDSMYVDEDFFPLISSDIRVEIQSAQKQISTKPTERELYRLAMELVSELDQDMAALRLSESTLDAYEELCTYRDAMRETK